MILEYLNVEQTLDYLQRETDYQYTFDDLKELNYLKSIDVFFFKLCTIYSTRTGGIAHSIQKVKGIFFIKDILFDNESDGQIFWFRKPYAHVEKIIEHLGYLDDIWQPYQKGHAGLVSTSDILDLEYNEDSEILSYSLERNTINNVELSDLRFKKSQLDKLIQQSKVSIDELREQVTALTAENDKLNEQLNNQADTPADGDKELSTRSQNLAAKIILALLDIGELDRDSLPYQYDDLRSSNRIIHDQIKANGMNVGHQKIGYWLDLAINQATDE